jgi:hypothetical protein
MIFILGVPQFISFVSFVITPFNSPIYLLSNIHGNLTH